MISANGGLPAHRYTPQVTPRWPRGSEPASVVRHLQPIPHHNVFCNSIDCSRHNGYTVPVDLFFYMRKDFYVHTINKSIGRLPNYNDFQDLRVLFRPVLSQDFRIFKPLILNLLQSPFENLETTPFL